MAARNSRILWAIPFLFAMCLTSSLAHAKYGGGTGKPDDPYQIATAEDLILLGDSPEDYEKHFILTADIDLDPNLPGRKVFDRAVIGVDRKTPFTGVFDGKGHTISQLTIEGRGYLGLFGIVRFGAKVSKLGLESVNISGMGSYVGSLVGSNRGDIMASYCSGTVSGNNDAGGLVGINGGGGRVSRCYSAGTVCGNEGVGGLVGWNFGTVTACYSTGAASGETEIGGLVGWNFGTVTTCYSTDAATGETEIGGLVGYNRGDVIHCYSIGPVSGQDYVGGLVGQGTCAINSFWDVQTSGRTTSAGGKGRTTDQMKQTSNYVGWNSDGEGIWMIDAGKNYPHLAWEDKGGELIPASSLGDFLSGNGTKAEPYLIEMAEPVHLMKSWRLILL